MGEFKMRGPSLYKRPTNDKLAVARDAKTAEDGRAKGSSPLQQQTHQMPDGTMMPGATHGGAMPPTQTQKDLG